MAVLRPGAWLLHVRLLRPVPAPDGLCAARAHRLPHRFAHIVPLVEAARCRPVPVRRSFTAGGRSDPSAKRALRDGVAHAADGFQALWAQSGAARPAAPYRLRKEDARMDTVIPEDAGLSSVRLRRINDAMGHLVEGGSLAGSVTLVARRGKVAHFEATGWMDPGARRPMERDAIFRIASMTKPITVTAVMMLFEEGYFLLDDPVA